MSTAQDLIDELLAIRSQKEELEAQEAFIREQLQGAMALGEMDEHQTADGVYQFANAKFSRCERNTYKLSPEADSAIRTIKERDIEAGLATRNVTIYYRLDTMK